MNKAKYKWLRILIPLSSLLLIIFLVAANNNLSNLKMALRESDPKFILLAFGFVCLSWVFETLAMQSIGDGKLGFFRTLEIVVSGLFFNAITPFSSGGQPAQLYMMHKDNISVGIGTSILARKFMVYQAVLVFYSLLVVIFQSAYFVRQIPKFTYMGLIGFTVNFIVILLLYLVSYRYKATKKIATIIVKPLRKIIRNKWFRRKMTGFMSGLREFHTQMHYSTSKTKWGYLAFLTFIQLTLYFSVPIVISAGLGLNQIEIIRMISAAAFVTMVSAFVPLPGAAFGAEGGFYVFFQLFYPSNLVLTALIMWRLITFYFPLMAGWITVIIGSRRQRKKDKHATNTDTNTKKE